MRRGSLYALAGAACYGISPVLIKGALDIADAPLMGTLISYLAASSFLAGTMIRRGNRDRIHLSHWSTLRWFASATLLVNVAQMLRYVALDGGDVTLVVLLMQGTPVFTIALTVAINRQFEVVKPGILVPAALVVIGGALIVSQQ
ncbi:MAG: EamA family transporter [Dehalococcoidia bacterium]|nr:EamA family transporter [Dehalococcoidia bacterium]